MSERVSLVTFWLGVALVLYWDPLRTIPRTADGVVGLLVALMVLREVAAWFLLRRESDAGPTREECEE